jgi:hypothetical protein
VFSVIGEPSVWLLTVCEISCSSVHKHKCVFLYYSYKDPEGGDPVSAGTARSCPQGHGSTY